MICSTRKDFLPWYLHYCEGKLADLKKMMHHGDLPSLKTLLAEAARLQNEITSYIPGEPESTDSDDEVYDAQLWDSDKFQLFCGENERERFCLWGSFTNLCANL